MRLQAYDSRDGYRVWLDDRELQNLIETMDDQGGTFRRLAGRLGGQAGLRREEASLSRPVDVAESMGETHLRVWEDAAKRDKYRETPIPSDLAQQIKMVPEFHDDIAQDDPVLDASAKTLNRWVKRAAEQRHAETGDEGWLYLTFHDLRRTWGTRLLEQGVLPAVVMSWGGWEDWETFREHYLGEFSPHALQRERAKVEWLDGTGDVDVTDPESHLTPVSNPPWEGDKQYTD
jgi:integrase